MNRKDSSPQPKVPLRRWEEEQDDDVFDPDKLLLCPYDANHQIRARRLPYHIIKCRKVSLLSCRTVMINLVKSI
ncbi:gametocyte-specific factor 1 [Tachysurus ichikawai]